MKELTYLIYILAFETLIFGGCGYVVFVMDYSGLWFLLAVQLSGAAYRPSEWIHGKLSKQSSVAGAFVEGVKEEIKKANDAKETK